MAQESRRSTGHYRPFITCYDPKGVIECGKISNPKKIPTKKKIESQRRKQKILKIEGEEQICSKEMEIGAEEGAQIPISFQLMEVCNGTLDSFDMCSTSSSPSSTSSWKRITRPKWLNLMVKLMGLEDAFPRSMPSSPGKKIGEVEKIVNQKKPESDLYHVFHSKKPDWSRRKLIQMIKAVKLGGFFKNSLVKRVSFDSDDRSRNRPLRFSCMNVEHPIIPKRRGELNLKSDETLCSMRIRSNPLAQAYENEALNLNGKTKEVKVDASLSNKRSQDICGLNGYVVKEKSEAKVDSVAQFNEDAVNNASAIEITDYVDDDLSPGETPSSTSNECNTIAHDKESRCSVHDSKRIDTEMDTFCEVEPVCEIKLTCTHEVETVNDHPSEMQSSLHSNKLKALLLSNAGFVESVEELFNLNPNLNRGLQNSANDINSNDLSIKILLDAASETMEHLALQWTHNTIFRTYDYTSLDLVLDEVCDYIKDLQFYEKTGENDLSDDTLLLLVKGDMSSNRTRVWDMGWRSTGSADEFEEIAREIEEMVLSGLIEEMLMKPSSVSC